MYGGKVTWADHWQRACVVGAKVCVLVWVCDTQGCMWHMCRSHVTHMHDHVTCAWVMWHICIVWHRCMSRVTQIQMSHATNIHTWCDIYTCVTCISVFSALAFSSSSSFPWINIHVSMSIQTRTHVRKWMCVRTRDCAIDQTRESLIKQERVCSYNMCTRKRKCTCINAPSGLGARARRGERNKAHAHTHLYL